MRIEVEELRSDLDQYLNRVRQGERLEVTEGGVPFASLEPIKAQGVPPSLEDLVRSGLLVFKPPVSDLPAPVEWSGNGKSAADYVSDQRR